MVQLLAFSLQDQVEKFGAYIGIAAFFGLAVLTILYFSQARELRRLRDWAGRAPERAQEVEARAIAQAEAARRVEAAPVGRTPAPATVAAAAGGTAAAAGTGEQATQVVEPVEEPAQSGNGKAPVAGAPGDGDPETPEANEDGDGRPDAAEGDGEATRPETGPTEAAGAEDEATPGGDPEPAPAEAGQEVAQEAAPAEAGQEVAQEAAPAEAGQEAAPAEAGQEAAPAAPPATGAVASGAAAASAGGDGSDGAPGEGGPGGTPAVRAPGEAAAVPDAAPADDVDDADEPADLQPAPSRTGESAVPPVPRATPLPRRAPAPAAPLRQPNRSATLPPRRPAPAAAQRRGAASSGGHGSRNALIGVGLGVIVLAAGALFATGVIGGGDDPAPTPNTTGGTTAEPSPAADQLTPATTKVSVLNGTTTAGLASGAGDTLQEEGYAAENVTTGNNTDQQRAESSVLYGTRPGSRAQARNIAELLQIRTIERLDADTRDLSENADVVVILGQDKAP